MKNSATSYYKAATDAVDIGLRKYMLDVFSYMSAGLALTALVSYLLSTSSALMGVLFSSPIMPFVIMLVPLGVSIYLTTRIASLSFDTAKMLFFIYAATIGISLAPIFLVYSAASISQAFFISSSMFLSMVIYGYTTEKDMTNFGAYLVMGVIGLIIASVVNIFTKSSACEFVISIFGVVIFTGLTAYDAQQIKSYYYAADSVEVSKKKSIFGALQLYLDFINLFLYVLRLIGSRRD